MASFHGNIFASSTSPSPTNSSQEFGRTSSSAVNMAEIQVKHNERCEELRRILGELVDEPLECMMLIDALQRLCIDYHFEDEIKIFLDKLYYGSSFKSTDDKSTDDKVELHEIALHFRLLRQAGYFVLTDVFESFKDKEGEFKQELSEDIRGLMSLFEASHLGMEGEDEDTLLDQANYFSHNHLTAAKMSTTTTTTLELEPGLARAVGDTLKHPFHKNLARFKARHYYYDLISSTHGTYGWVSLVQKFARMDFNMLQFLYHQELLQIFKWWEELGLSQELKFARDQPLKWYLWSITALPEPKHSQLRLELTKPISLVYIIDDIFDVYGTLDELILFTEAVNKWETTTIKELPEYMKICFKALDSITNEISDKVLKEHGWNPITTLQKAWASLCDAFLIEAKWFGSKLVPKSKEYLENGVISSGVPLVLAHLFFLLGQGLTQESVLYCVEHNPPLISCTATILRLWDDLGSAKDEKQEGHDGSYIECYMKEQEGGSSIGSAKDHVFGMISDSWKQLNRECISKNHFSPSFKRASLNIARMVPLMYSYNDNQNHSILEEYINSLLSESVPF
ncbi:(3S,6E)-nerolidol synthase 1-like [Telopea speciosissima]|uniref:(3S,6E)-nerolidol synthase 1-like n=1 Tax=Telopea speciosissima TaxID=54955 RepID=UPI001CC7BD07|nr:(3S,6E)-nerolidol synthase 1-like [Telopea speciosissima]